MEVVMNCGDLFDNRYRILEILGQGGMSRVYLAENIKLGTLWAIKEIEKKPYMKTDLLIEPNILKKLSHPALPRIFDIVENNEYLYIIVDYIKGASMDKLLKTDVKFPEDDVVEWARQICDVLIYLHNFKPNPIIYRDMKPSNIMLTDDGKVKLIDFGIAREFKQDSDNDTVYIGTRGYAAPEQYGSGQTSVKTDIYSLGVTLYHLITGKNPNEPPFELMPVRQLDSSLSAGIERIIGRCTRQNPGERYRSVYELLADLNGIPGADEGEGVCSRDCPADTQDFQKPPAGFKKLVITIWDNAEFGCEMAYVAARLTGYKVMLVDLDLLSPKADIFLNVKKTPDRIFTEGVLNESGLNIVMSSIEKNLLTPGILTEASVRHRELRNLHILTGNYRLDNYEYYRDESLTALIEKAYLHFDITILLVNRSIYDSYTVISLIRSDINLIPVRADMDRLREFNRYLVFLKEKQQILLDKSKFVAYEYDAQVNLSFKTIEAVTGRNYLGSIRYSAKRARYRNLRVSYARRMEKEVRGDYGKMLAALGIMPGRTFFQALKGWLEDIFRLLRMLQKSTVTFVGRRRWKNACTGHAPQAAAKRQG